MPFKGAPEVLTEIMAGRLDFYLSPASAALPSVAASQLQALAVASAKRADALPNVPTTTESGFANSDYEFWVGAFVSAATPAAFVENLYYEIARALKAPSVQVRLKAVGGEVMHKTPREFADQVRSEIQMNATLVKDVGLN